MMKMPKTIYVRLAADDNLLMAEASIAEVMADDGPCTIGVYALVETVIAEKTVSDAWRAFEVWADGAGIGEHRAEWGQWWACWAAGYGYGCLQTRLDA